MQATHHTPLRTEVGGLALKNPVLCASGEPTATFGGIRAAIDAGAGAVIAKSVNESAAAKRQIDTARYALLDAQWRELPWVEREADGAADGGMGSGMNRSPVVGTTLLCRSGLVPATFDDWLAGLTELSRYAALHGSYVGGSIIVADSIVAEEMATRMEAAGLSLIELNLSAPHAEEAVPGAIRMEREPERIFALTERIRRRITLPLLVKLSGQTNDVLAEVEAARQGGADAVVLMGRMLGFMPDIARRRPVLGTFGAVGGGWALPLTLRWIAKARIRFGPALDLIATNGVRSGHDVVRCLLSGARAVEVCSTVMSEGYSALTRLITELREYLDEHQVTAEGIVGEAADAVRSYQDTPDDEGVGWRHFVPAGR